MASKSLGTLTIDLVAKTAGFVQGMDKAERESAKFRKKIEKDMRATGKAIGDSFKLAASAAAFALVGLTKQSLAAVDANAKLARSLGGTYTGVKSLGMAMGEAGVDGFEQSITAMNQRLGQAERGTGKAALAVKELGLNLGYMASLDVDEKVAYIADAMQKAGISMQRAASYAKDFGFTQEAAADFFMLGGDNVRNYRQEIERMGLALNSIETDRIEKANDAMERAQLAATGLGNTLALRMTPWINDFSGGLELLIIDLGNFITKFDDAVDVWERAKGDDKSYQAAIKNVEIANEVQRLTAQRMKIQEELQRMEGTSAEKSGRYLKNKERLLETEKKLNDITNARKAAEIGYKERVEEKGKPKGVTLPTLEEIEAAKKAREAAIKLREDERKYLDEVTKAQIAAWNDRMDKEREAIEEVRKMMLTEEQVIKESYQKRKDAVLEAITLSADEKRELVVALQKKEDEELAKLSDAKRQKELDAQTATLDNYENLFSSLHDLSAAFGKENSKTARAMFGIAKAAAVAKAMLAISGAAQAMGDTAVTTEQRIAHAATIASAVAGIVSTVKGVKMDGMAHDGIDAVPKTGTWLLEKGERVMTAETSAKLDNKLDGMGGRTKIVNVIDPRMVADYLSTDAGEEIVMNIIGRNQAAVAAYARG